MAKTLYFQFPDGTLRARCSHTRLRECDRSKEHLHISDHIQEFRDSWNKGSIESATTIIHRPLLERFDIGQ